MPTLSDARRWAVGVPAWFKEAHKQFGRLAPFARPHKKQFFAALIALVISSGLGSASPIVMGRILDTLTRGDLHLLLLLLGTQICVDLLSFAGTFWQARSATAFSQGVGMDLRLALAERLQRSLLSQFKSRPIGEITNRIDGDVRSVTATIGSAVPTLVGIFSLAWALVLMPLLSWQLALVAIAFMPLWFLALLPVGKKLAHLTMATSQANDALDTAISERLAIRGIVRTKSFSSYAADLAALRTILIRLRELALSQLQAVLPSSSFQSILGTLAPASVLLVGSLLISRGLCSIGTLVAFLAIMWRSFGPISTLANVQAELASMRGVFERFFEVLDLETEVRGHLGPSAFAISFRDVTFSYGEQPVFSRFSLDVAEGARVMIQGRSGAGKSTLAQLLMRFHSPASGRISVGGVNLTDIDIVSLRSTIAYVPQETNLLTGTILENVSFGRPSASREEVAHALDVCLLADFVDRQPCGLDSRIGSEGALLSGGQKQRLMLARALIARPKVLLLDEATSALDLETEAAVLERIEAEYCALTVILICHRTPLSPKWQPVVLHPASDN